ncbi:MAG: type II/IV secretion system protein [Magnetococcales bacterium]|nr:type II/IV secretion system protein [Magnetococcales bacterium]
MAGPSKGQAATKGKEKPKVMLGELLVQKGVLTQDQLRIALTEQKKQNAPLGQILVKLGFLTEGSMRDLLGESIGQESVDLTTIMVDGEAIKLIPKDFAKRANMFPVSYESETKRLTVAMSNTYDVVALDKLRSLLGEDVDIQVKLGGAAEIDNAISQYFGFEFSIDGILREIESGEVDPEATTDAEEYSQPLVRLVDALMADAVKKGASDIHIEPEETFLSVRLRVDGVLRQVLSLHKQYQSPIIVRVKVLAGLNIAENRVPQDGHISRQLFGRNIDFRVSSMATHHGENLVLRILDRTKGIVPLTSLGFSDEQVSALKLMMARPEGIILVTGPTGSGKTTTLYSMLDFINDVSVNIMTLEDPVEYPMPQIRQSSVNPSSKMGFADGIRAMLRQDPDIMLVGEIRDQETAEMALRAAMTGHQVYSTVHTNSAMQAITRLRDIGVPSDILAGNIIGVVGQRLIRLLCKSCRKAYNPGGVEVRLLRSLGVVAKGPIYRHVGCKACEGTGYKGRMALIETIKIDPEMDALIATNAPYHELRAHAKKIGFKPLAVRGIHRVLEGITTLAEISRVADLTEGF